MSTLKSRDEVRNEWRPLSAGLTGTAWVSGLPGTAFVEI